MKTKKDALASLGEWKHINCLDKSGREKILDEALRSIALSVDNPADSVDVDVTDHTLPDDIPGGSVSFLFERTSDKAI